MKAVIISDTPLGYGSPQIEYLKMSIESFLSIETLVFSPVYPDREIIRNETSVPIIPKNHPFSGKGLVERLRLHSVNVNTIRPEVLVLVNPENLFLLGQLKYRPKIVIYYGLENIGSTLLRPQKISKKMLEQVDLFISPEINRAISDAALLKLNPNKVFQVLNCAPKFDKVAIGKRLEKISYIYGGTLSPKIVDLDAISVASKYGSVDIFGDQSELEGVRLRGRLHGVVERRQLNKYYSNSHFSLICWKVTSFGNLYAAPNKAYQSISLGVPIISYPYPQVRRIIATYGCGFLAKNFELESFEKAIAQSRQLFDTGNIDRMVAACEDAFESELNWGFQIDPIIKKISKLLSNSS